jgi:two-component system, sensor histidine kinase and response regulator
MQLHFQLDTPTTEVEGLEREHSRRTLLIVDDEEGPRQALRIVFKDDYSLLLAADGGRAVELANQHRVDAAVLDIRMCGMSGIELLERLKSIDPAIEVIMLTAYETIETARQALRLGACDYLNKPFDIASVRSSVRHAMERRSIADEMRDNATKLSQLKEDISKLHTQQELLRARGEIYASIMHDINNPMTSILNLIDLINYQIADATRLEGQELVKVKEDLSNITKQVNNCVEISRRYLKYHRDRSKDNPSVALNQVLADLHQLLRFHPSARSQRISLSPLARDTLVKINSTELIHILLNLSINACQCSKTPHSVRIGGKVMEQPVNTSGWRDTQEDRYLNTTGFANHAPLVALSVADDGPGISPELLSKVFDPFFSTKPADVGTGLGLSIVQRLVTEAKGAIHLHTRPDEGTEFTVYLPALKTATDPRATH